jgi:hypothetical protein
MLSEQRERLRKEADQLQQESLLAAEEHYAAETLWYHLNYCLGIPATILAAVAGGAAFSKINHSEIVAGSLSIVVAILSSLTTFLDPKRIFSDHHAAAKGFESLYHRAGVIYRLSSLDENASDADLQKRIEELRASFIQLNQQRLAISALAHKRAREAVDGIRRGEVIRPGSSAPSKKPDNE